MNKEAEEGFLVKCKLVLAVDAFAVVALVAVVVASFLVVAPNVLVIA